MKGQIFLNQALGYGFDRMAKKAKGEANESLPQFVCESGKPGFSQFVNGVTVWKSVEPMLIDFDVTVSGCRNSIENHANASQTQAKAEITRAELEAQIRVLVGVEKQPIEPVATQLGVSLTTVRRMCRTLRIGPYEGTNFDQVRSKSSQIPFGWNIESGVLIQNPTEWPWVLKAYELRKSGLSLHKISAHFTEQHVPTKNGGQWSAKTISQILEFNARHIKREKTKLRRSKCESKN